MAIASSPAIHFLNATLAADLLEPIASVEILNPCNEMEFLGDKLSVVDVKAVPSHIFAYQETEYDFSSLRWCGPVGAWRPVIFDFFGLHLSEP